MRVLSRNAIAQISCGSVVITATAIWAFCFHLAWIRAPLFGGLAPLTFEFGAIGANVVL